MNKFRLIAAARAEGDVAEARTLFDTIGADDFPVMREFPMRHGILADAKTALYFIDHDWDDDEWCGYFITDVIRALEGSRSKPCSA
jgi:hypothetical protein